MTPQGWSELNLECGEFYRWKKKNSVISTINGMIKGGDLWMKRGIQTKCNVRYFFGSWLEQTNCKNKKLWDRTCKHSEEFWGIWGGYIWDMSKPSESGVRSTDSCAKVNGSQSWVNVGKFFICPLLLEFGFLFSVRKAFFFFRRQLS